MNTKNIFPKTFYSALFAGAMLFATSSAFAQVKIGTNPTTIDATKNLEVEASTTGRKTSIDKTTGQVTIADGTQGLNKVLTSDANGNASWQSSYSLIVMAKNDNTIQPTGINYAPPVPFVSGTASAYTAATGEFTAPSDGFYQYNYSYEILGQFSEIVTTQVTPLDLEDGNIRYSSSTWNYRSLSGTKFLLAGEKFTPTLFRGGSISFNTAWKIRRVSIIVFQIQ